MKTAINKLSVDIDKLIEINPDVAVDAIVNTGLPKSTLTYYYKWKCDVEKRQWAAEIRAFRLSDDYAIMWRWAQENGDDCHQIIDLRTVGDLVAHLLNHAVQIDGSSVTTDECWYESSVWQDSIVE